MPIAYEFYCGLSLADSMTAVLSFFCFPQTATALSAKSDTFYSVMQCEDKAIERHAV